MTLLQKWRPLRVDEVVAVLGTAPFRWWFSGGVALELHIGGPLRDHADIDVGVGRRDTPRMHRLLSGWDLLVVGDDASRRWDGDEPRPDADENNIWARRDPREPWRLDINIDEGTHDEWVHGGDPSIRRPWSRAVLSSSAGLPYLAPDLQLLVKSHSPRPKDHIDARVVVPELTGAERSFLRDHLPAGHAWERLLERDG